MSEAASDDRELLARIARGDGASLKVLFDRVSPLAWTVAFRILGNRAGVEDVVQETFTQVWQQARAYLSERGSAAAWVVTIARTRALDRRRKDERARQASLERTEETATICVCEDRARILQAMDQLPEEQRRVVTLAYFEGLSQSEIAEAIGAPLGTVKTRARAALLRLQQLLSDVPTLERNAEPVRVSRP